MSKSYTPEILNTPNGEWPKREFPKWNPSRQKGGIGSFIIGTIIWILLAIVFLVVGFASLICWGINNILTPILSRPVRTPWLIGLILVFFFPINLFLILGGWLTQLVLRK